MSSTDEEIQVIQKYKTTLIKAGISKGQETALKGQLNGAKLIAVEKFNNEFNLHPENQMLSEQDLDEYINAYTEKLKADEIGDTAQSALYAERIEEYQEIVNDIASYPESTISRDILSDIDAHIASKINKENETISLDKESKSLETKLTKLTKTSNKIQKLLKSKLSQEGHLYPVVLVQQWTKKLQYYNEQLDDFIATIQQVDVRIPFTWLRKIVAQFVKRINFALALLRYYIVKTLWSALKTVRDIVSLVAPILMTDGISVSASGEGVKVEIHPPGHWIFTGNIWKIVTAIIEWIKAVINWFLKPYMIIVQFVVDFMTYTPPFVQEAAKLITKVVTVPPLIISKMTEVAAHAGEDIGDIVKNVGIKMEPITGSDLMGSNPPEKPVYAQFSDLADEYEVVTNKKSTQISKTRAVWDKFVSDINATKPSVEGYVPCPQKETEVYRDKKYFMLSPKTWNAVDGYKIGIEIFGNKKVLESTIDYINKYNKTPSLVVGSFNPNKYDVRRAISYDDIGKLLSSNSDLLYSCVFNYLKAVNDNDKKGMKANVIYYQFIKDLNKGFGMLPVNVLLDMQTNIVEISKIEADMKVVEKRSWLK